MFGAEVVLNSSGVAKLIRIRLSFSETTGNNRSEPYQYLQEQARGLQLRETFTLIENSF